MARHEPDPGRLGFSERDFKVCDFCRALNPVTNDDCFVCGWEGRFHTDRETVKEAMDELNKEYGELTASLFSEQVLPSAPPRTGFWTDVWHSLKRLLGRA